MRWPGTSAARYEYSNFGGGLLGTLLARRAGMNYDTLLEARITGPLGMQSTHVVLTPDMQKRLAAGHNARLDPAANWNFPPDTSALAGAGGLRSTAADLLTFLEANLGTLGTTKSPLAAAMNAQLATRRPTGIPGLEIALGWHVSPSRRQRDRLAQRRYGRLPILRRDSTGRRAPVSSSCRTRSPTRAWTTSACTCSIRPPLYTHLLRRARKRPSIRNSSTATRAAISSVRISSSPSRGKTAPVRQATGQGRFAAVSRKRARLLRQGRRHRHYVRHGRPEQARVAGAAAGGWQVVARRID